MRWGRRDFLGAIKYFRHILIWHEIFFENVWWATKFFLFILIFLNYFFQKVWGSDHKILNWPAKGFKENKSFSKISKIHSGIWQIVTKLKSLQFNILWTFHNFAFRIETGWALRKANSILKNRSVIGRCLNLMKLVSQPMKNTF